VEILTTGIVGLTVASSFLYAVWPLVRPPEDAGSVLPDANGRETREHEIARLLLERDQAYKSIMDIEFDRQMGKLSDEDFAQMMEGARARALEVLRKLEARGVEEGAVPVRIDEREAGLAAEQFAAGAEAAGEEDEEEESTEDSLDARLEEEILAYRKVKPAEGAPKPAPRPAAKPRAASAARFCPSCGAKAGESHNFCAACGFKLK